MKLIFCLECGDVVRLRRESRLCQCRSSGGQYINELDAEIWGKCVPLGFDNSSLAIALNSQPVAPKPGKSRKPRKFRKKAGKRFDAFIIPKNCPTVKVIKRPR